MKNVDLSAKVRHGVRIEGFEQAGGWAAVLGSTRQPVDNMLEFAVPPGYRRPKPTARPELGRFIANIEMQHEGVGRRGRVQPQ
jgi:hypothetical protein